jgi:hypothetical protein
VTAKSGHNAASKGWFYPSFFKLFMTVSLYITKTVTNVTIYDFAKSGHNEDGYKKLESTSV